MAAAYFNSLTTFDIVLIPVLLFGFAAGILGVFILRESRKRWAFGSIAAVCFGVGLAFSAAWTPDPDSTTGTKVEGGLDEYCENLFDQAQSQCTAANCDPGSTVDHPTIFYNGVPLGDYAEGANPLIQLCANVLNLKHVFIVLMETNAQGVRQRVCIEFLGFYPDAEVKVHRPCPPGIMNDLPETTGPVRVPTSTIPAGMSPQEYFDMQNRTLACIGDFFEDYVGKFSYDLIGENCGDLANYFLTLIGAYRGRGYNLDLGLGCGYGYPADNLAPIIDIIRIPNLSWLGIEGGYICDRDGTGPRRKISIGDLALIARLICGAREDGTFLSEGEREQLRQALQRLGLSQSCNCGPGMRFNSTMGTCECLDGNGNPTGASGRRDSEGNRQCQCISGGRVVGEWTGEGCSCTSGVPNPNTVNFSCTCLDEHADWIDGQCQCDIDRAYYNNGNHRCECPRGSEQSANGKTCECIGGSSWNGERCQCPHGKTFNSRTQQCEDCPSGTTPDNGECKCANGEGYYNLENQSCTCVSAYQIYDPSEDKCEACPANPDGSPNYPKWKEGGPYCDCGEKRWNPSNNTCETCAPPEEVEVRNGKCECKEPFSDFDQVTGACVCKPPSDTNQNPPPQCLCEGDYTKAEGSKCECEPPARRNGEDCVCDLPFTKSKDPGNGQPKKCECAGAAELVLDLNGQETCECKGKDRLIIWEQQPDGSRKPTCVCKGAANPTEGSGGKKSCECAQNAERDKDGICECKDGYDMIRNPSTGEVTCCQIGVNCPDTCPGDWVPNPDRPEGPDDDVPACICPDGGNQQGTYPSGSCDCGHGKTPKQQDGRWVCAECRVVENLSMPSKGGKSQPPLENCPDEGGDVVHDVINIGGGGIFEW